MKKYFLLFGAALILLLTKVDRLIVDGDTFWAIKVGEWIAKNKSIPYKDTFSWTAYGKPWVAHEWLFDYLIYKFHAGLGYYGIILFVFIGLFFITYYLWKLYAEENKNPVLTIIVFTIVIFMLQCGIAARPHLYGYVFFIYFFYVLYRRRKLLWTLPPVAVVWANMHGSVVLGIAMVLLQLTYDTVYYYIESKKLSISKNLLAVSFIVPLCSLINPYGVELWFTSFHLITNKINKQIIEWQPPDFREPTWLIAYLVIIIFTVCVSYSYKGIADKRKLCLLSIYLLGTFYEAITGMRYFPYLAICWGLFFLTLLPNDMFSERGWNKKILLLFSVLVIVIILNAGKPPLTLEEVIDKKEWPVDAVKHLDSEKIYNKYVWGGYLIYKDIPVFIDGRADVYWKNSDVFKDYLDINNLNKDPIDLLNKYDVEQIIIPVDSALDFYLKRAGCIEKYRDDIAVIYNIY